MFKRFAHAYGAPDDLITCISFCSCARNIRGSQQNEHNGWRCMRIAYTPTCGIKLKEYCEKNKNIFNFHGQQ